VIDPFQRDAFEAYARRWLDDHPGVWRRPDRLLLPHEGEQQHRAGDDRLSEPGRLRTYRARIRTDEAGMANFRDAQEQRFILSEERTFLTPVEA